MDNEKVKGLVSEYGEERIEKILDEILTNKDVAQFMKQLLNNENIQKALEEGDEGKILKIVGEELEKDGWNNSEDVPTFLWICLIYLAITSGYIDLGVFGMMLFDEMMKKIIISLCRRLLKLRIFIGLIADFLSNRLFKIKKSVVIWLTFFIGYILSFMPMKRHTNIFLFFYERKISKTSQGV